MFRKSDKPSPGLRLSLILVAGIVASGCTPKKIHWIADDSSSGNKGDIKIDDVAGIATWNWGPQQFSQQIEVTKNQLTSTIGVVSGSLTLKLHDGTQLVFAAEYGAIVCHQGCNDAHMPIRWGKAD